MAIEAKCLLGHGACPAECLNHKAAKKITEKLGDNFDPTMSRLTVVFGDVNPDVNVAGVARAMANCVKEKPPTND